MGLRQFTCAVLIRSGWKPAMGPTLTLLPVDSLMFVGNPSLIWLKRET